MSSTAPGLRPGLHVVRRDSACVQVGLDPPHRVILPADPSCLAFLERLRQGPAPGPFDPAQVRLLHDLRTAGLLLEQPPVVRAQPRTVALHDHGYVEATDRLSELLVGAGLGLVTHAAPDLAVAMAAAPLPRAVVDPWLAEGTTHLVVAGTGHPGRLRVGPLVSPGLTACLRCVDAAEAAHDPRRPLLVEQLTTRVAAPVDPLTLTLAIAWAARDIAAHLVGGTATTWSTTVDLGHPGHPGHPGGPGDLLPVVRTWERQPECGCCWDDLGY